MATIHISQAEASRDLSGLLSRVRSGDDVVIDDAAVRLSAVQPARGRRLSESIAMARATAKELGDEPVMDEDFAADMREIISNRKPRDTSAWD